MAPTEANPVDAAAARYRRILLSSLDADARRDPVRRQRAFELLQRKLEDFCAANASIPLDDEMQGLRREFAALKRDPDGYGEKAAPSAASVAPQPGPPRRVWLRPTLTAAALLLFWFEARSCGWFVARCFDSGWFAADTKRSQNLRVAHGLGATPGRMQLWFSPNAQGEPAHATEFNWPSPPSGNPVSVWVDSKNVVVAITGGTVFRNVYDGDTTVWTRYDEGYLRIVAQR